MNKTYLLSVGCNTLVGEGEQQVLTGTAQQLEEHIDFSNKDVISRIITVVKWELFQRYMKKALWKTALLFAFSIITVTFPTN